jgi:hypothetical protein
MANAAGMTNPTSRKNTFQFQGRLVSSTNFFIFFSIIFLGQFRQSGLNP